MKLTTPTESQFYDVLAPDLKRKVDERRKEAAEWDKLYGKTTGMYLSLLPYLSIIPSLHCFSLPGLLVEEQYRKAVEREEPKKV
ncbi:hypothetical protein PSTT_02500 [Puccinia striiformis]|uniref:Uncharacterized protein n=1 Tax=Puccinia striiformis TaxID=27350 RepID=A0A2S4VZH6_9BASI|nr:hypothetical protein PSTT_02500 [Puccinia striiformis]